MLRNAVGGGGVSFPGKKLNEGVRFNVICITRWWVGVKFPGKKRYVTMRDFTTSAVCISWPQEGRSYRAWKPLPVEI